MYIIYSTWRSRTRSLVSPFRSRSRSEVDGETSVGEGHALGAGDGSGKRGGRCLLDQQILVDRRRGIEARVSPSDDKVEVVVVVSLVVRTIQHAGEAHAEAYERLGGFLGEGRKDPEGEEAAGEGGADRDGRGGLGRRRHVNDGADRS